jgi:hypothetical protein
MLNVKTQPAHRERHASGLRVLVACGLPHFIHFNLGSYLNESQANVAFEETQDADFWSSAYEVSWSFSKAYQDQDGGTNGGTNSL